MISSIIKYPFQVILLILIQVLILNNIQFSGFVNPYVYIIFILWLPIETPKSLLLLIAFIYGLCIDLFSGTMGMHASATVFLAFCRPFVLRLISPRDGYEASQAPGIQDFGFSWFMIYASALTLLHHFFLFFVEVFRFTDFFFTLGRLLVSAIFTLILIIIFQLFRYNSNHGRS